MESSNDSSSVFENYEYCGNVKKYLEAKLKDCGKSVKELNFASGYALGSVDKFKRHCSEWHELLRPIPRKYLDAIGGKVEDIGQMVELDLYDFEEVCKVPRFVRHYTVRVFAGIYSSAFFGTVSKSEFTELGPKGEMALSELIEDGILQEVTSTRVWLRDPSAELIPEDIRKVGRRDFDKIWPILQCLHRELPVPEQEAIERIKAHPTNGKLRCCIKHPQLVTIFIEPDGKVWESYYKPGFKLTKQTIVFGSNGSLIGRSFIQGKEIEWSKLLSL